MNDKCTKEAQEQFESILKQYIFPLFPLLPNSNTKDYGLKIVRNRKTVKHMIILHTNGEILFYPCLDEPMIYYKSHVSMLNVSLTAARTILKTLMENSEYVYSYADHRRKRFYGSNKNNAPVFLNETLDLAFEVGLCNWCGGNTIAGITVYHLLKQLEIWATKTYEGKRIPFGFIVDTHSDEGKFDYLCFLKTNTSAVFADGTSTNVLIDKKGFLIEYQSVDEAEEKDAKKIPLCPREYIHFTNSCRGNRLGLLLLETGDILMIKQQRLVFAKRHSNWIFFDYNSFRQAVLVYLDRTVLKDSDCESFINSLYLTVLDVSFAHTGGCIALVNHYDFKNYKDCIKNDILDERLESEFKDLLPNDRIRQRKSIIRAFVKERDFYNVQRKLRQELVSLVGATVISNQGKIIASGSIVRIDGGSQDGGRTAATMHMAKYGFAIKISEDGQIHCYGQKTTQNGNIKVENLLNFA